MSAFPPPPPQLAKLQPCPCGSGFFEATPLFCGFKGEPKKTTSPVLGLQPEKKLWAFAGVRTCAAGGEFAAGFPGGSALLSWVIYGFICLGTTMGWPGKWKHGNPNPAVCPSCLILSHSHLGLSCWCSVGRPPKKTNHLWFPLRGPKPMGGSWVYGL